MKTRKTIVLATVVLVAAIGVIFVTRPISDPRPHSPVTLEFFHAGEIRNALFTYSNDHNGGFPKELSELPSSSIPPEARQFHDPETKQASDWIYYPGYRHEDGPNTIILAAPRVIQTNQRIAVFSDWTVRLLDDDDFVKRISDQLNRK